MDHNNLSQSTLLIGTESLLDFYIVEELTASNIQVTVLVKKLERGQKFKTETSVLKEVAITPQLTPKHIFAGTHTILSTLGIQFEKRTPFDIGMGYLTNLQLLEDAQKAGVKKLIYLTDVSTSVGKKSELASVRHNFISRLKASGMEYTILQVEGLFSDYIDYLDKADKGKAMLFTNNRPQFNPIHLKDLASACADALDTEDNEITLVGPAYLTRKQVMEMAFKAHGKHLKSVHVPKYIDRFFVWLRNRFRYSENQSSHTIPIQMMSEKKPLTKYGQKHLAIYFQNEVEAVKRFAEGR